MYRINVLTLMGNAVHEQFMNYYDTYADAKNVMDNIRRNAIMLPDVQRVATVDNILVIATRTKSFGYRMLREGV